MIKQFLKDKFSLKGYRPFLYFVIIGLTLYGQTLFFDFTYLDDNTLILDNQSFLSSPSNLLQSFREDVFHIANHSASYYRPILTISFMSDYQMGGTNLFVYHLSNILFHLLSVCLLFVFLCKLKYKKSISFLVALIFLIHPVFTQAVAWIPGRNDSLITVFILASFIYFINFLERKDKKNFILHLLFFALAIFTKETALFALPLFVFYTYFLSQKKNKPSKIKVLFAWLIVLIVWFVLRELTLNSSFSGGIIEMIKSIIFNLPAMVQLIGKIIFPFNLSVLPIIQDTTFIYGFITLIILGVLFFLKKDKRWNYIIFGLLWFFLLLLPSFIRIGENLFPDFIEHRLYLPAVGFFLILLEVNPFKNWRKNDVFYSVILGVVILCSSLTFFHSLNFRNKNAFWENAVENSQHYPLAHRNLGAMYFLDGDFDNAAIEFRQTLEINPNEEMAHNNLGLIYFNREKFDKAEEEYNKEIEINPFYDNVYYNLGLLYYKQGRIEETISAWERAFEINYKNLDVIKGLAILYHEKGDYEKSDFYAEKIK